MKLDLPALRYEPACFAAGTLVHTKEGLKPIETIQVGDWVLSKHESGKGEREYKRVTQTFKHEDRQVIRVNFGGRQADGADKWNFLIVTPEHPIWVQGKGWKPAENDSAAIFAKACFGHPSPSKRQKSRGNSMPSAPQPSCYARHITM